MGMPTCWKSDWAGLWSGSCSGPRVEMLRPGLGWEVQPGCSNIQGARVGFEMTGQQL